MRSAPILVLTFLLTVSACASADSNFQSGAWRLGLAMDAWDDSSLNDVDADQDVITADLGKLLGPNSEFGLRLVSGDMPDEGVETGSIGPYYRWYFNPVLTIRPWVEGGISFAGLDYGAGDESGWEFSAAVGAAWYFFSSLGLEAFVRTTNGNYELDEVFTTQVGIGLSYLW